MEGSNIKRENMRITENKKEVIINAVKSVDVDTCLWFFGSRAGDNKKGVDKV